MRRFYVPKEMFGKDTVKLSPDICKHIHTVLRLREGDLVEIFDGECAFAVEISEISRHGGMGIVKHKIEGKDKKKSFQVRLCPAVIKAHRMDFLVEKAVELGVNEIQPVVSLRSVVKPAGEKLAHWNKVARASAAQSGRVDVPPVRPPMPFTKALELDADIKIILHEKERHTYLDDIIEADRHIIKGDIALPVITLLSGPEGGFTDEEIGQAMKKGYIPCGLGDAVLRAETAAIVAVAVISQFTRKAKRE